jgi:phage shock protein C
VYCTSCGKEIQEKSNFCYFCGARLAPAGRGGPAAAHPRRRLTRSRHDKMIAGVCGGFAEYIELDPTIVRIIWLLLALLGGGGVLAYIIAWIVMPLEPEPAPAPQASA